MADDKPAAKQKAAARTPQMAADDRWAWRVIDIIIGAVIVLSLFIGRNIVADQKQLQKNQSRILERLAGIEASRFTSTDGLEIWREISAIREAMALLPQEVPPKWFKEQVDGLALRLDKIDVRLDQIERDQYQQGIRP